MSFWLLMHTESGGLVVGVFRFIRASTGLVASTLHIFRYCHCHNDLSTLEAAVR